MPRSQRSNPNTKHQAIALRKEPTSAESKLWSRIRNDKLGITFRRQHAVGNYIPDFPWHRPPGRCARPKPNSSSNSMDSLRSQHLEHEEYDQERTKYLESQGYKVIRFWNNNVLNNIEEVILAIIYAMENESHKK